MNQRIVAWSLRLGLGFMYFYSGQDLVRHPQSWLWAVPQWFQDIVGAFVPFNAYLQFQGSIELLLAFVFLAWFIPKSFVKIAAFVSVAEIAGILLLAPFSQFLITFRDIAALGSSLALLFLLRSYGSITKT